MTTTYSQNRALFNNLAALLTGQLLFPEDAAYEQVRQVWNGRVKTRPAASARCLSIQDVIHTVRWTRAQGLPLSVRAGGHDVAGRALSEGVAIDLSQMGTVTVDPDYAAAAATLALSSRWSIASIHSRQCYLGCCSIL